MNEPVTDRELLELAARAYGIELIWNDAGRSGYYSTWRGLPQWNEWTSLDDDGDALRLAVKLSLEIAPGCYGASAVTIFMMDINSITEPYGDDANAATRRAITRAAAQIGQGLATNPDSEKP